MRRPRHEAIRAKRDAGRSSREKKGELEEKVRKIASHRETRTISRKDMPEPWAYIENKFPRLANVLSKTTIYKNANTAFCKKLGIPPDAGGVFVPAVSAVLVCYARKIPDEAVVVHEMLHYCSQLMGSRFVNADEEEDFAYLESIPYLAQRGYGRHWIAESYLLPYYTSREVEKHRLANGGKALSRSELRSAKADALAYCKSLVSRTLGHKPKGT